MSHGLLRAGALLTLLLSSALILSPRRDWAQALEPAPAPAPAPAERDTVDLTPYLASREARHAKVPWKIGEYFQFSIDWSGLNGGNAL
ncbi:MAG TPA: hypothetical protein VER38_03390, partial [Candidatus Eisenbacteria bacterium]|nr:hypothetical protein [Candidatus Eisenbacteria bacterium]